MLRELLQAVIPTTCACCGEVLVAGERQVCISCLGALAATGYSPMDNNLIERRLIGRVPYVAASSLYHFRKGDTTRRLIHAMKYHDGTELCYMMGRQLGLDLAASGRFDDVEILIPVPLHWLRWLERGYNQSEIISQGISDVMHRPVVTNVLVRHRYTRKQSLRGSAERGINVEGAFRVRKPSLIEGKHVLLVDDVLTTGATIAACADALEGVNGLKISVATLAAAD